MLSVVVSVALVLVAAVVVMVPLVSVSGALLKAFVDVHVDRPVVIACGVRLRVGIADVPMPRRLT
ncbi:MAG: hypothetical protein ACRDGB_05595 [Candidatus Limnocylindria bacterium]